MEFSVASLFAAFACGLFAVGGIALAAGPIAGVLEFRVVDDFRVG